MSDEFGHGQRLTAVESEVQTIRSEMGTIKADVKGLGAILGRIEEGILRAQDQQDRQKVSPIAIVSFIVTVLSMMVGGSWLISGSLATTSIRLDDQEKHTETLIGMRNREFDNIHNRLNRLEERRGDPSPRQ